MRPALALAAAFALCGLSGAAAAQDMMRHIDLTSSDMVEAELGVSTNTARRTLEDLAAYRVVERISEGPGKPVLWRTWPWGRRTETRH
jgi:predicted ArsR family transcriptional regulator